MVGYRFHISHLPSIPKGCFHSKSWPGNLPVRHFHRRSLSVQPWRCVNSWAWKSTLLELLNLPHGAALHNATPTPPRWATRLNTAQRLQLSFQFVQRRPVPAESPTALLSGILSASKIFLSISFSNLSLDLLELPGMLHRLQPLNCCWHAI